MARENWTAAALVTVALASAIHLDWHFARPVHHRLSLGLPWHWALSIPVFALVAWYVVGSWPHRLAALSIGVVGGAILLGGIVEPAWEYFLGGAPFDWAFGPERNKALVTYVAAGLVVYTVTLLVLRRRRPAS